MPYVSIDWAENRVFNMYHGLSEQLRLWLSQLGLRSIPELVGRTDLIEHLDYLRPIDDASLQERLRVL